MIKSETMKYAGIFTVKRHIRETAMFDTISAATGIDKKQIEAVARLLDEGATIPFMARYRKEATGSLDEVAIGAVRDGIIRFKELEDRKKAILKSLEEREILSHELKNSIESAGTLAELEDRYQKYRPKKRTRAMAAREKGLEPLAVTMMEAARSRTPLKLTPLEGAQAYCHGHGGISSPEQALAGARDIVAENISEDASIRNRMRILFHKEALISSSIKKSKEDEGIKYRDYFDWSEPARHAPSHRVLAMLRGEREGFLTVHALPPGDKALEIMESVFIKGSPSQSWLGQLTSCIHDSYKRLLGPAMENELLKSIKERADRKAIDVFVRNIQELLLSPPLGRKSVLAIDPGFRTGCKVVCLDSQGTLLDHAVIFPDTPQKRPSGKAGNSDSSGQTRDSDSSGQTGDSDSSGQTGDSDFSGQTGDSVPPGKTGETKARDTILKLVKRYKIEAVAIGNGTAGRETEAFIRSIGLPHDIPVVMVDESGASIYSASQCARDEFPHHDITVRGAVSIGRRLMDPLAELVKIDPKSLGVGQYQHDVDEKQLHQALDDVVSICVNRVGVELNTASPELLTQVAGLNRTTAGNIVEYRNANGPFTSRKELLKVPRLGPRAFEQCAGFLRIRDGKNPLDASGIHPESYPIVERMAMDKGVTPATLMDAKVNSDIVNSINLADYVTKTAGLPTLEDIAGELLRPGRDPRQGFKLFSFAEHVHGISDLVPGMILPGIVTNVTAFGAFVDIGVHQDGLVHVSQIADRFVKNPSDELRVHQRVSVRVLEVDIKRRRISLS
ncbi:MAG: RNA-binding transcriptional accessory protein, partial [Desulfamplus sp.]|nr:RNA-binding transcriptional accessory protein [Desulfamplus sp.]